MSTNREFRGDQVVEQFAEVMDGIIRQPAPGPLLMVVTNLLANRDMQAWDSREGSIQTACDQLAERDPGLANNDTAMLLEARDSGILNFAKGALLTREEAEFRVSHSPMRALRPPRDAAMAVSGLYKAFSHDGFHFGKVTNEVIGTARVDGMPVSVLPNKFPITGHHFLIAPELEAHRPQYLTEPYHHLAHAIAQSDPADSILGYNSRGALSSVNNHHFHYLHDHGPVPAATVPDERYPAEKHSFTSVEESWDYIDELNSRGTRPYNIIYSHSGVTVFPRAYQGTYEVSDWTSGFAFYEMAGTAVALHEDSYLALSRAAIADELAVTSTGDLSVRAA